MWGIEGISITSAMAHAATAHTPAPVKPASAATTIVTIPSIPDLDLASHAHGTDGCDCNRRFASPPASMAGGLQAQDLGKSRKAAHRFPDAGDKPNGWAHELRLNEG
jgi:hypothetical protein